MHCYYCKESLCLAKYKGIYFCPNGKCYAAKNMSFMKDNYYIPIYIKDVEYGVIVGNDFNPKTIISIHQYGGYEKNIHIDYHTLKLDSSFDDEQRKLMSKACKALRKHKLL
jgi:hypothetical protein